MALLSPYVLLILAEIAGVPAHILDQRGHGRVEDRNDLVGVSLMILSTPLVFLCGFGMIAVTIWALFALSFWKVAGIVVACQAIWGGICWYFMGWVRVHEYERALHAVSIPLVFTLRAMSAVATVLLFAILWHR